MSIDSENHVKGAYDEKFYDFVDATSSRSAKVVVPLVLTLVQPTNVIDVGCGRGIWLKVFSDAGVKRIHGVDGPYVKQDNLYIPSECFTCIELSQPFTLPRGFDLAVCLEVAEHLPRSIADHLVRELTHSAELVLFSAAIPGQTGTEHINTQWHAFWHKRFKQQGFECFDILRHQLFSQPDVSWWYKQNMFLYATSETARKLGLSDVVNPNQDQLIPVSNQVFDRYTKVGGLLRALRHEALRALRDFFSR